MSEPLGYGPSMEEGRAFGLIMRGVCWLAGVDPEILARCPARDVGNVRTVTGLLLGVWLWQSALFAMVGHMMLARPGEISVAIVLAGVGLATIMLLIDSYVIVRSSWTFQGLAELKRGGLEIPGTLGAKAKNGVFFLVRLFVSLVMAQLMAVFLGILLFSKDIAADLDRQYHELNSSLISAQAEKLDARIAGLRKEQGNIAEQVKSLEDEKQGLRRNVLNPLADDPEIRIAVARAEELGDEKANAEQELSQARAFATNELAGIKGAPGNTGIVGSGPVRRAAEERIRNAERAVAMIAAQLSEADARLAKLRSESEAPGAEKKATAAVSLEQASSSASALAAKLQGIEDELRAKSDNREALIRQAVMDDPSFVGREDGFLARFMALKRLTSDMSVLAVVLLLDAALFGIELAAVLAKMATFIPATYATLLARDDYLRAHRMAHELAQSIDALYGKKEPPEPDAPSFKMDGRAKDDPGAPGADDPASETASEPIDLPTLEDDEAATDNDAPEQSEPGPLDDDGAVEIVEPAKRKRGRPRKAFHPDLSAPLDGPDVQDNQADAQ